MCQQRQTDRMAERTYNIVTNTKQIDEYSLLALSFSTVLSAFPYSTISQQKGLQLSTYTIKSKAGNI